LVFTTVPVYIHLGKVHNLHVSYTGYYKGVVLMYALHVVKAL